MKFAIDKGLPYLISNGKAYPVEVNGEDVRVDLENATLTSQIGGYTLSEIHAKCGTVVSSIAKAKAEPAADTGKRKTKTVK